MSVVQPKINYTPGGVKEFLAIAYPLIISNASMSVMQFADRLFLSWAGPENIAAVLPAGILLFTFWSIFLGISEYTNTFVAQFHGAERPREIASATWQGIHFAVISSFLTLPFLPMGLATLQLFSHAPDVLALEKTYFTFLFFGGPFFILNGALCSFYSGRGKTKVIMSVNIGVNFLNLFLDYVLIFGKWGFPEWGIKGAAIGTTLATACATGIFLILFLSQKNHQRFATRSSYKINPDLMKRLIRFGTPSGIHFFLEISSFTMFVFLVGRIGEVELAATNIALSLNMLAWFPMLGASIATATMVGQYIGRNDYVTARKSAFTAFYTTEAYMLAFAVLYIGLRHPMVLVFQGDPAHSTIPFEAILALGATLMIYVALYQMFDAMVVSFSGALRGAGDTSFAMWACVVCGWGIFVPGTWMATEYFQLGVLAAWAWVWVYCAILGIIYLIRFNSGKWKSIEVIPKQLSDSQNPIG
jgi:multidrug resistance protein, MATE family